MIRLFLISLLFVLSSVANADQNLIVENIWIREAPPTAKVLAAYMTLKNPTDQDIILICADSPTFKSIMFHKTEMVDGLAKMRRADEIIIPANSSFNLAPGGVHMMLMGKKSNLTAGDNVELNLIFKTIEDQIITATVKKTIID